MAADGYKKLKKGDSKLLKMIVVCLSSIPVSILVLLSTKLKLKFHIE